MIAFDFLGVSAFVGAAAVFITAVATAYVTVRTARTVNATHEMVRQVDQAVNGKSPGERSIGSQVTQLYDAKFPPASEDAALPLLRRIATALEIEKHENNGEGLDAPD